MGVGSVVLLTGMVWVAGRWSEGKNLTEAFAIGAFFVILGLSILNMMNDTLALTFAVLLLITAVIRYGISIGRGIGWSETQ